MVKSILDISKSMKIKTSTFLGLLVIVAGLAATMPSAFAAEVSVPAGTSVPGCEDTNECWLPAEISIGVGETVTWSNDDTAAHTVTAGDLKVDSDAVGLDFPNGFDSSLFLAGTTFEVTFDTEGTFPYFCMVHPWMAGTVIVGEAMGEEMMEEAMMSGAYLGLDIDPMLPLNNHQTIGLALSTAWLAFIAHNKNRV